MPKLKNPEVMQVEKINKSKASTKVSKPVTKKPKTKRQKAPKKKKQPVAIYENPYVLSPIYRQVAWQLNKAYDEVKQAGLTSNNIKLFEQSLENFYEKYNLKVKNKHHISMQKHMSMEAVDELSKITLQFADVATVDRQFFLEDLTKGLSPDDLQRVLDQQQENAYDNIETNEDDTIPWKVFDIDKFKQIQEMYGVDSVQEFIDWTDEMERYRTSSFLQTVLSSDQIADIFAYAGNKDSKKTYEKIAKMITNQYNRYGYIGDELRQAVIKRINTNSQRREQK